MIEFSTLEETRVNDVVAALVMMHDGSSVSAKRISEAVAEETARLLIEAHNTRQHKGDSQDCPTEDADDHSAAWHLRDACPACPACRKEFEIMPAKGDEDNWLPECSNHEIEPRDRTT